MSEHRFVCADCGEEKIHVNPNGFGGTGYGIVREGGVEKKVCYDCCGKRDRADMSATGRAVLYLTERPDGAVVTNWPGTLKFRVRYKKAGSHNIAGRRTDVWFTDADGREWWGWNCGDNQILRCRRLRSLTGVSFPMIVILIIYAHPAAGRRLLTRPDGMGTVHPGRCPGERAALTRPRAAGTAHPARCDRPRAACLPGPWNGTVHPVRCPGNGRATRPRAAGTVHPARCDPAAGSMPRGNRPRAGARLLTRPDGMGTVHPARCPGERGRGEPFTLPDATGRGSDALGNTGRGPRAFAHPARWNGNRSPGPMQPAAGPMPWGTGRAHPAAGRRLLTLPDATGRGSDARGTGRAAGAAAGTVHPARCDRPRAGACSPCPMEWEPLTRPDAQGNRAAGNRSPGPMQPAAGRRLLTLPDGMGTAHPARCNRPRVRCPGNGPRAGLLTLPDGMGTVHPARCPGEPAAGNRSPCPMQPAAGPMPRGTGRACSRGPRGTAHPARCDRPRVRCPGGTGRGPALIHPAR